MRAMILAAGRGKRLGAYTDTKPKPLVEVGGRALIEYNLMGLQAAGVREVVINVSYLAEQIQNHLGDGSRFGLQITYSYEPEALETGGGIFQALPLLGDEPFLLLSADVVIGMPLQNLPEQPEGLAHLVLVSHPDFGEDYGLVDGKITLDTKPQYTYGSFGVIRPELFANCKPGYYRLPDVLRPYILQGKVTGEIFTGLWHNIGAPKDISAFTL